MGILIISFGRLAVSMKCRRQRRYKAEPFPVKLKRPDPHFMRWADWRLPLPTCCRLTIKPCQTMNRSGLITRVEYFKPKLPSFEREKHRAEIGPLDTPAVDDHAWLAGVFVSVPLDPAPDHGVVDL